MPVFVWFYKGAFLGGAARGQDSRCVTIGALVGLQVWLPCISTSSLHFEAFMVGHERKIRNEEIRIN